MKDPTGRHIIAELYQCDPLLLDDLAFVEKTMVDAALLAGAEVREVAFHKFAPVGVSGVVIISESHLTVHTFPEYSYASIDIYTCGQRINPNEAYNHIANHLCATCSYVKELLRGFSEILDKPWFRMDREFQ